MYLNYLQGQLETKLSALLAKDEKREDLPDISSVPSEMVVDSKADVAAQDEVKKEASTVQPPMPSGAKEDAATDGKMTVGIAVDSKVDVAAQDEVKKEASAAPSMLSGAKEDAATDGKMTVGIAVDSKADVAVQDEVKKEASAAPSMLSGAKEDAATDGKMTVEDVVGEEDDSAHSVQDNEGLIEDKKEKITTVARFATLFRRKKSTRLEEETTTSMSDRGKKPGRLAKFMQRMGMQNDSKDNGLLSLIEELEVDAKRKKSAEKMDSE
jgi:hypothetical protein